MMAAQTLQHVIRKAVADEGFRHVLLNKPDEALSGYDLTEDERRNLSILDTWLFSGGTSGIRHCQATI
jgi:hypothetical protein